MYQYNKPYEVIHGYVLETPLTTQNAGMCKWAYAKKEGRDYFVKQFLSPKYPALDGKLSTELVHRMRLQAEEFYRHRKQFYDKLFECRTGNIVVVQEFFREGPFYYISTERIRGPYLPVEQVCTLSEEKKRVLLRSVLYCMTQLHERGIVHADLKPDNILIRITASGYCTAKIIDFEASFFADDPPEEVEGDQVYFSPEAVLRNNEEDVPLTVQTDMFALGVLFHQYWVGSLPGFDTDEYNYISEAVLEEAPVTVDPSIPADVRRQIRRMLSLDPAQRPTAKEAWTALSVQAAPNPPTPAPQKPPVQQPAANPLRWHVPGDDDL